MNKIFISILLTVTLLLSSCGSEVAITTQDSSVAPIATATPEEKVEIIKGKSLDKIGYKCKAPQDIEIEKDIFLDRKSSTGDFSSDMGVDEILGEDTYTLISVYFYGPHSLGSEMLNFMYLQAFPTTDVNEKNSIKIGEDVYSFDDLQPYLVFKSDDICVYDVYALTGDDDLQAKITEQVGFQNEMVTNCVNATAEEREKYSINMTEEDYVTYEDYNYLHKIAEYYKTHIGEMIVKKSKPANDSPPPALVDEMTVAVLTPDGKPVPNIGVYGNPKSNSPLHKSADYAISSQDGIAVLQQIRKTFAQDETIEIALCDRNQSDHAMQQTSITIPVDSTEIVKLVWNGKTPTQYEAENNNRLTIQLFTADDSPIVDAWFSISKRNNREEKSDGDNLNTEMLPEGTDLSMLDYDRSTDKDGKVVFTNLPKGEYSLSVYVGKPPSSNVASTHPLLQQKFKMQRYIVQHSAEDNSTQKLIFTE